jgi:acetolactate synthase-1/2/3 large subunit
MPVTDPDKLDGAITEMMAHDGGVFMDIIVDKNENVYPMIPAGAAHNELLLGDEDESSSADKNRV